MPFSSEFAGHFSEGFPFHVGAQDVAHLHHHFDLALEFIDCEAEGHLSLWSSHP